MRHTIYEDPATHRFAIVPVPPKFVEGDKLPVDPPQRWFDTRDAAVAALADLLNEDDG